MIAFHAEFKRQLDRTAMLYQFFGINNEIALLQRALPQVASGAALMLACVMVSSAGDVEYGAIDQPGNIHLQDWLKQRVPAKATPLHKAEHTLAHIASTVKVLRLRCSFRSLRPSFSL